MIHALEFQANQCFKLALFSVFVLISLFLMVLFTRAHYFIDIFIALFFGHFFWIIAERSSYLIDTKLFHIPFHKRFPNFPQKCWNCKYPINEWLALNLNSDEGDGKLSVGLGKEHITQEQAEKEFTYA
jgi:hypothetical protein